MRKLILFLFVVVASVCSSNAMIISVINKTDTTVTLSSPAGGLMSVDPGATNEIYVQLWTFKATLSLPYDDSLGFEPATDTWLNWMNDYVITVTKARFWNDPTKIVRVSSKATHIEYVTVINSTSEDIRVIDMKTHRLLGIVASANSEEGLNFQTFRIVNKANLMFRHSYSPTLRRIPTGHVNIPLSGLWNVTVTEPSGFRLPNGDVLKTELTPAQ